MLGRSEHPQALPGRESAKARRAVTLGVVALLAFGAVGTASAAPLNWTGTLVFHLGDLPPFVGTGGGVAIVNGMAGGVPAHLQTLAVKGSRGAVGVTGTVPITDPWDIGPFGTEAIQALRIKASMRTGTFQPISGGAGSTSVLTKNVLPVSGLLKLCLLSTECWTYMPLLLTQHATGSNAKGVGIGGLLTTGGSYPALQFSLEAAPWTIKTGTSVDEITTPMTTMGVKQFVNRTLMGFAHDPASGTTSTAQPSGVVQLITPMQVTTNFNAGSNSKMSMFGVLTVRFIPEPSMLLLLASGVAGLALLGRHRMSK